MRQTGSGAVDAAVAGPRRLRVFRSALALAAAVLAGGGAAPAAGKPKVPVGVDPGGVAVAVIGDGLDYTRPDIAARLARDGEGEIVGFDLVDRDRKPYSAAPPEGTCAARPAAGNPSQLPTCRPEHPALTVLRRAPAARIGVFRVDAAEPRQIAEAIAMVDRSPAHIVLFQAPPPDALLREAASRFPRLAFKVPPPPAGVRPTESLAGLENVAFGCAEAAGETGACGTAAALAALAAIAAAGKPAP